MPTVTASPSPSGVAPDDHRPMVYLVVVGLVVLLLAIVGVAVTTLTGSTPPSEADQARAAQLRKLPVYWTVHTGDTYARIAEKTGLSIAELQTFNPRVDPSTIRPGQRLKLRQHVPKAKPKPLGPRVHVLRTGESFGSISAKRGVSIERLQQLNPKLKATALQPGTRVRLRK